ncbi:hypothetical protein LZ30DRAFT_270833 [Colletotrichum cereale]|nr:hypothetical protein LZ30DRAFT_270833 [Colletotrichum cereale]
MPQSWGKGRCDKHISRRNPSMSPQDPPRQPDSQNSSSRQSTDSPCWSDMFCLKPLKHRKNSAKQEEVGRNHTRPNLGRTDAQGGEEGCRCLNSTACLVEELGTKSASSDPVTMDVLLGYFRESLASCAAILNCNKCTLASEINMLLAMAGRYMSFLCERVIQSYVGLQRCNNGRPPSDFIYSTRRTDQAMALGPGAKSEGVAYGESTVVDMWLSTYRIENGHERAEVLRCLVKVQISEFYKVLSKLKARSGGSSGPSGAALGGRRENAGGRGGSGSERGLPAYGNAVEHEGSFSGGIRGIETSVACEDKKMLQYGDCRDGTKMVTHRLHVAMQPADWNFEELFEVTKKRTDARKRRYLGNKQDERGYWTRRLEMLCQSHA